MALLQIQNIAIKGFAASVPTYCEDNKTLPLLGSAAEAARFIEATGIEYRHTVHGTDLCTSDLCYSAAIKLLEELDWVPADIDCLIFVTQTPDYILPATSCILQHRLGLSVECYALDISLGCSGWVYGLSTIASLMASGSMKKGLLLAGDTTTVTKSSRDKSTYPLFGDAGTATAIEYVDGCASMMFHTGTDGKGAGDIMIPDGGFRTFYNENSLVEFEAEPGIFRNRLQSILNGPAVFTFGISKAPRSVNTLLDHFKISKEEIDYFVFHQANLFMNEKIRTKLKIDPKKVPYSLHQYGNTSSASIPLTIVNQLAPVLAKGSHRILASAFGVGLSWASAVFDVTDIVCPDIIMI
jgi:3-oxoacyl-[acyl-carrier-protein] synthase-3